MYADAYLRAVARSKLVPELWIDDACQEMRIALWRAGRDPDPMIFSALDSVIVKRTAIDFRRTLYGRGADDPRWQTVNFAEIESWLMEGEEIGDRLPAEELPRISITEMLSVLPPREAQILLLNAYGYRYWEIGQALGGLSQSRVAQLAKRAREQLRR